MASPVNVAKLNHEANGFTEIAERGKGFLLSRKPGTNQYSLTAQSGNRGWHFGNAPFDETNEVNTTWNSSGGLWDWEMLLADYEARIRDSVPVTYQYLDKISGEGIEIGFSQPVWANNEGQTENVASFVQVTPVINDDLIVWSNVASGWNIRVQAQTARLSKYIDIDSLISLGTPTIGGTNEVLRLEFTYSKIGNLTIWVDGVQWNEQNNTSIETNNDIEFRDNANTPVFWLKRPRAWDSELDYAPIVQRVRRTGSNFYAEIDIPWSWLQSAIYPITIDPTVDEQVAAADRDAIQEDVGANCEPNYDDIYGFGGNSGGGVYKYAAFQVSITIANGATIDTAYVLWHTSPYNSSTLDAVLDLEDNGSPSAIAQAINNISNRTLTGGGIDWDASLSQDVFAQSPSIVDIIQGLVDGYDYSGGAYVTAVLTGQSATEATLSGYDFDSSYGEQLYIEYSTGGGSSLISGSVSFIGNLDGIPSGSTVILLQRARPISDISTGSWVNELGGSTNLYQSIDEVNASDADYIISNIYPTENITEMQITSLGDPGTSGSHRVKYRYSKLSTDNAQLIVELLDGAVTTASWTHTITDNDWHDAVQTLSDAEADSISDYTDLRLRFTAKEP